MAAVTETLLDRTKTQREESKNQNFYCRYKGEAQTASLHLRDHIFLLHQLFAIHTALEDIIKDNLYAINMPMSVKELLFKSYAIKADLEYLSRFTNTNKGYEVLPVTQQYISELHEMALKSKDLEVFTHFLVRAMATLYDNQAERNVIQKMYARTLPHYDGDNYGVTFYCATESLLPRLNTWLASLNIKMDEMAPHADASYQKYQQLFAELEVARNRPRANSSDFCCGFFAAGVAAAAVVAGAVEVYRLVM